MNTLTEQSQMNHPRVRSRAEWLAARLDLLKEEKELTRRSDELARRRQELPWLLIARDYRFETDAGSSALADLFQGLRVVMDRERWFSVVMGEKFSVYARSTEKLAQRVPLPSSLAANLAFRLAVA